MINLFKNTFVLAIINDTAKTLAVVTDKNSLTTNMNYIIGGLLVVLLVVIAVALFGSNK